MTKVFYCEKCRESHGWDKTASSKSTRCTYCREPETCFINHTHNMDFLVEKQAPESPPSDETEATISFPKSKGGDSTEINLSKETEVFSETPQKITADTLRKMILENDLKVAHIQLEGLLKKALKNPRSRRVSAPLVDVGQEGVAYVLEELKNRGFDVQKESVEPSETIITIQW